MKMKGGHFQTSTGSCASVLTQGVRSDVVGMTSDHSLTYI